MLFITYIYIQKILNERKLMIFFYIYLIKFLINLYFKIIFLN